MLRKYSCVRLGNWEIFCGISEKLWVRPDPEPPEPLGKNSEKV